MRSKFISDLKQEFSHYPADFPKDLMAGLTVTAVALPLALAFGVSSGANAAAGLITAILAGVIIGALGGGFYQISGPTGAMAAILVSLVAKHGMRGIFLATFLAGVVLCLAGLLRLGRMVSFIPAPVITGFTSGIAVIIALGQVDHFFGVTSQGSTVLEKLASYGRLGFSPDWPTFLIGLFVVLFMVFYPKKWSAYLPSSLAGIVIATAACALLSLDVPTVGTIPASLIATERLHLADLNLASFASLAAPAVSIAMLGMIESLLCGVSAARMTGVPLNSNQELLAQGIGNLLIPFAGGIPATAAIARTSVAIKSGAKTRAAGIIHALGLLLSMLVLSPIMSRIPLTALSGVLMVTAWRMNEKSAIQFYFSRRFKGAIFKYLVTLAATVLFDLTVAILIGVGVGMILMLNQLSDLEISFSRVIPGRIPNSDESFAELHQNTMVCYLSGPLLFANTGQLLGIAERLDNCSTLLLSMRGVSSVDISGGQALIELLERLNQQGVGVYLCALPDRATEMLLRAGIHDQIGADHFFWSVDQALCYLARYQPQ